MAVCLAVYAAAIVPFPKQIALLLGASSPQALPFIKAALPAFSLNIIMQTLLYNLIPVYQFYGHHSIATVLSVTQPLLF